MLDEDVEGLYDRICAVRDYAKEYHSYAGANGQMESSVKFIYKTEGIGE